MSNLSVADWRTWKKSPTDPPDPVVQAGIDAAEEAINGHCGRRFVVNASTSTTRVFAPICGSTVLDIDDAHAVTVVAEGGSTIAAANYQLEPLNGLDMGGLAVPYDSIRLLGLAWTPPYRGQASVSVTGIFGWLALPDVYTEATKILAADIIDQKDIRNGVAGFADFGAVRVRENATVTMLLRNLKRTRTIGIA